MENTTNLGLMKPAVSDTFANWLNANNSNMDKFDGFPIPMEKGSNSQLSYIKFSDGTVLMWGAINYGTKYPCHIQWAASAGYASDKFDINLPVALVSESYAFIPHVTSNINPDMWFVTRTQTFTRVNGSFLCAINDSGNVNTKILNIIILGRWK